MQGVGNPAGRVDHGRNEVKGEEKLELGKANGNIFA